MTTPANVQFTGTGGRLSLLDGQTALKVVVEVYQSGSVIDTTELTCTINEEGTAFESEVIPVEDAGLIFTPVRVVGTMDGEDVELWTA